MTNKYINKVTNSSRLPSRATVLFSLTGNIDMYSSLPSSSHRYHYYSMRSDTVNDSSIS